MERTIRVWIGNDFVELTIDEVGSIDEDEFYKAVAEYIDSIMEIEVI